MDLVIDKTQRSEWEGGTEGDGSSRVQTWAEGVLLTATGNSGTLGWWG